MKEFFTSILASIEALFHHKPGTTEHEEAKVHLEGVKADLEPDQAEQLDKTVAAAVASHAVTPAGLPPTANVAGVIVPPTAVQIGGTQQPEIPPEQPPA